jgi:hypothetical protein
MTKATMFRCDRCGKAVEVKPDVQSPRGWSSVRGKDLCGTCEQDLDTFLRGARIELVAVEAKEEEGHGDQGHEG